MLLQCDNCPALVDAEIIGSYVHDNEFEPIDGSKYLLCKCPQCWSAFLVKQTREYQMEEIVWGAFTILYPGNEFHINPVIPEKLRNALTEAIKCYKAGAFTAATIMCRRAIEGFCVLKGVKEKTLDASIKKLKNEGLINEQLYEWANELRSVGNDAAHDINKEFGPDDTKDILDFTIAIFDFTYSFKDKFDKFKQRRKDSSDKI